MGEIHNFKIGGPDCQCCNPPGKWERIRERFIADLMADIEKSKREHPEEWEYKIPRTFPT